MLIKMYSLTSCSLYEKEGRKEMFYLTTHSTFYLQLYGVRHMVKDHSDSERGNRPTRCSSMVRAFAHGVMGRRINPSWGGPIELFLVPASAPRLV